MTKEDFFELVREALRQGRITQDDANYMIFWAEFFGDSGQTQMLISLNNTCQGIVDGLPFARGLVNHYQPEPMTDYTSGSYVTGNVTSLVASWAILRKGGTMLQGSKIPQIANFGSLLNSPVKIADQIFKARLFMESLRFSMFGYKYYKNYKRLNEGLITMTQFESLVKKDSQMYVLAGTTWALPGTSGLWVAGLVMAIGNVMNEWKTDEVLKGKKR